MLRNIGIVVVCVSLTATAIAQAPQRNGIGAGPAHGGNEFGRFPGGPPPNAMFDVIDADGDGTLSARELRRAAAALKQLDADKDGKLTRDEAMGGPVGNLTTTIDRVMQHDQNGDGKLLAGELPPQLVQMLAGADANGDGAIDRTELAAAVENAPNRFAGPGGRLGGGPGARSSDPRRAGPNLMQYDRNGDGQLSPDEVPQQLKGMLRGADQNRNGKLDAQEVQVISQRMNERLRGGRRLPPGISIGPDGVQNTPQPQ